ncbi:MAG: hypothetical protein J0G30_04415 [Actinomycetales bacterium]|nr:hypothetical protein [Actinomycetales bacterium]
MGFGDARDHYPVPWGRVPVPEIPVPPFAAPGAAREFTRLLALYVADLAGDGLDAGHLALFGLLEAEARELGDDARLPGTTALRVAIATAFPVAWTPHGLDAVLHRRERAEHPDVPIRWGEDPDFTATRTPAGLWDVERHERGSREGYVAGLSDDDLVLLRLAMMAPHHPYPLAWSLEGVPHPPIARAARAARGAWRPWSGMPYLRNWQAERAAAERVEESPEAG